MAAPAQPLPPGITWGEYGLVGLIVLAVATVLLKFFDWQKNKKPAPTECQTSPDGLLVKIVTEALQETSRINAELVTTIKQQGEAMREIANNQSAQAQCIKDMQGQITELGRIIHGLQLQIAQGQKGA